MKALINGKLVEVTEEEIMEFAKQFDNIKTPQTVTDKERISALEQAITDLASQIMGVGIDE